MLIDFRVNPAFYEDINRDSKKLESRHKGFHLFKNSVAPIQHIENQMKCAGIDMLVLMGDDRRTEFGEALVTNDEIKHLEDISKGKFIGFASVDPLSESASEELIRAFKDLNLKGVKLNLSIAKIYPNDKRVLALLDICRDYKKPVVFDSGFALEKESMSKYTRPIEFEEILYEYQDLKICLTQFAWPWLHEMAMLMLKYRNLYTDTGLLYFDSAGEFYKRLFNEEIPITWIDRSLRHQIMFASGNPRFEQIRMAKALGDLGLRESTLDLIKGKNALEFIGLAYED